MDGWMRSEKVSTARIGDEHDDACDLLTQWCSEATRTMFLALFSLSQVSRKPVSSLSGTHLWSSLSCSLVIQFPSPLLICPHTPCSSVVLFQSTVARLALTLNSDS